MEFGLRDLVTLLTVVGGGFATVRVIETKLARVMLDVADAQKTMKHIWNAIDGLQEGRGVMEKQLSNFGVILSPDRLAKLNYTAGETEARLRVVEERVGALAKMHNGEHKPVVVK
jgi:hypothetical protein